MGAADAVEKAIPAEGADSGVASAYLLLGGDPVANKAPLLRVAARLTEEALARGLLIGMRVGSGDPAIADTTTLAPPLMTPTEVLDRIPEILRQAIKTAAG